MPLDLIKCKNQSAQLSQSFGLPENDCSLLCLHIQREAGGNFTAFTPGLTCGPVLCQKCSQWSDSMIQLFIIQTCLKMVHFAVLRVLIARKEHYCSRAYLSHDWVLEIFSTGGVKVAALREIITYSSLFNKCQSTAGSKNNEDWHEENYEWTGIKSIISQQLL